MADLKKMQPYSALNVNLSRQNYGPLDVSNVFYSEAAFKWYLKFSSTNPEGDKTATRPAEVGANFTGYPYEGQVIAVEMVEKGAAVVKVYVLGPELATAKTDGTYFDYTEVGAKTLGDGNSIALSDEGILSIVGFSSAEQNQIPYKKADGTIGWQAVSAFIDATVVQRGANEKAIKVEFDNNHTYTITLEGSSDAAEKAVMRKKADGTFEWVVSYSKSEVDTELAKKVDKETGKSLVSDTEITKLATVEQDAEKNIIEVVKVDGTALTVDSTDRSVNITGKADKSYVDTELAKKQNVINADNKLDVDYTKDGTTNKVYTATEKTKLAGVAEGAQVNVIEHIKMDGADLTPDANKRVDLGNLAKQADLTSEISRATTAESGLSDRITNLEARGRFLSTWDCTTGKPNTEPPADNYELKSGDYYIVGKVGTTNYKPDYVLVGNKPCYVLGHISTVVAESNVGVNDIYIFDAATKTWSLIHDSAKRVTFGNIDGEVSDNAKLVAEFNKKVDKVTGKSLVSDTEITKLATVEQDAEKNIIEYIKMNGADLTPDANRRVDLGTIATSSELDAVKTRVSTLEGTVGDSTTGLVKDVNALKTTVGDSSSGLVKGLADEISRATTAESGLNTRVAAIEADYLKAADKTELQSNIDAKVSKTTTIAGVDLQDNITKSELLTALNVADGAQVNVIEHIKMNGADVTPDTNKRVDLGNIATKAQLDAETERATAAESTNATAISTETTRAQGIEAGLRTDVDKKLNTADLGTKINALTDGTIQAAKVNSGLNDSKTLVERLAGVDTSISNIVNGTTVVAKATDADTLDGEHGSHYENKIETVKVGGTALTITDKAVDIETEEAGALATKDEVSESDLDSTLGAKITKLDGIAAGAQVNVLEGIQVAGNDISISSKKANIALDTGLKYDTTNNKLALDLASIIINGGNASGN